MKRSAAKEIFGEIDSNSNDNHKKNEKRNFRIKKDQKGFQPKTTPGCNPLSDVANLNAGYSRPKLIDMEGQFKKNRLDSKTDQNLRETRNEFRRATFDMAKEEEKLRKQKEIELDLRNKYTSFYNAHPKEQVRSSSYNNQRLQNNFLKSNGFQGTNLNTSKDDERESSRQGNVRNYDKPWLINSTNKEQTTTQSVIFSHSRTGEGPRPGWIPEKLANQ